MSRDRAAQNAVRDRLVAAALAQRPRSHRRRTAALAVVAALLGASAVAEATGLLATGEPIESLWPAHERKLSERYRPPDGVTLSVTAPDADYRYGWGVGVYTSKEGLHCALAGNVVGAALGRERDGRFHPYGPGVAGACGSPRLRLALDMMRITGPHPRTLLYGRTSAKRKGPVAFVYQGKRHTARVGPGRAFLLVFEGIVEPGELKLAE